jgi:hypothetical protein
VHGALCAALVLASREVFNQWRETGFEPPGSQSRGAQTASPVIGMRFAVTRLRFPDRSQIFPVYATREFCW